MIACLLGGKKGGQGSGIMVHNPKHSLFEGSLIYNYFQPKILKVILIHLSYIFNIGTMSVLNYFF
jgi:hypothetical protein